MNYDVTIARNEYIGGSDIPVIMGISSFKKRYDLLLEKAGLKEDDFTGNRYTVYGQKMEPQIRDYINRKRKKKFEPNRIVNGDIRCHTDGFNGECVLEIKTTSRIFEKVDEYIVYLVQLLLYMKENGVKKGILAVYERPADFDPEFDSERLRIYEITASKYKTLTDKIYAEIDRFRADLERIKANPLLSEEDLQPNDLVSLSNMVILLEQRMAEYKVMEKKYKEMKQELYEAMQEHDVKSWKTVNGVSITRVDGVESTVKLVTEFDLESFKNEEPTLYEKYLRELPKETKGRGGYVKITMPKKKDA